MEEILKKLKVTYVGNIHNVAYFNVEYSDGFGPNTTIKVADTCTCCFLESKLVGNCAKYNDKTTKTLMILNQSETLTNVEYTLKLYEGDTFIEEANVVSDPSDVPALIKENVNVKSIGDRIIEIVFDEPVRHLESGFDFVLDRFNRLSPPALTNNANMIYYDEIEYYTKNTNGTFKVDATGKETDITYDPTLNKSKLIFIDLDAMKLNNPPISLPLTPINKLTEITNGIKNNQSAYVAYRSEYSEESHKASAVLINYYFRYFGTDDEGTLYEPKDKPIDWLGYFAGHDITTKVSSDNRKIEIQFDAYSLPTASIAQGDVPHQLIINYAKTFPNYSGDYRIADANNNPFPIIRESVEFIKDSIKAKVTNIVALSKDEVLVYFDKPVLCQSYDGDSDDVHYQIITINGITPQLVERYDNSYNILHCHLTSNNALPVGSIDVTIGSIIDACGYKTDITTKTINVVAIKPKVLSMKQGSTLNEGAETVLDIKFSEDMSVLGLDLIPYFQIYKIDGEITELINPISIANLAQSPIDTLKVSIVPALEPGGLYEIHIFDMEDIYGTVMEDYKGLLHIKDMSAPEIQAIYLTDHTSFTDSNEQYKIAFLFNETMESENKHSLTQYSNYMFYYLADPSQLAIFNQCNESAVKFPLNSDNTISVDSLKGNTIARIVLNQETYPLNTNSVVVPFTPENLIVKAGYCDLTDVKYLTNSAGNVLDFVCPIDEVLSNKVNLSTLTTTDFKVIDSKTVVMTYNVKNNEIIKIEKFAFSLDTGIIAENVLINPVSRNSVTGIVTGTLTITFPENSFDDSGRSISIDNSCEDIFGNNIIGVNNVVLTYDPIPRLVKAYVSNIHSDTVIFGLEFNEEVKLDGSIKLAGRDYSVSVNGGHYRAATAIGSLVGASEFDGSYVQTPYGPRKTLYLQYDNANDEIFDSLDTFKISVTVPREQFKTVDKNSTVANRKPVEIFTDKVIVPMPSFVPNKVVVAGSSPSSNVLTIQISPENAELKLDEITTPLNLLLVNSGSNLISPLNFNKNGLFKSLRISSNTNLTTVPTLALNSTNGKYLLSVTFENDVVANSVTLIEFEFIDALPTINGIPVLDTGLSVNLVP